jgi:sialidase-1
MMELLPLLSLGGVFTSASRASTAVDVFTSGLGGYACYRIPSMIRLPDGSLSLFAEGRKYDCNDHGWVDIVYKISRDNGTTWSPVTKLYGESNSTANVTIGNPAPVVVDGRVLLAFCRNNHQVLTLRSADAKGSVWPTTPTDITQDVLGYDSLAWVATGPPGGIVVNRRVLIGVNWYHNEGDVDVAGALVSDDGGQTWPRVKSFVSHANEVQIAFAPNGSLLLNARHGEDSRLLSWSNDMSATWSSPRLLPHSGSPCEGSTIRANDEYLLFSHNNGYDAHGKSGRYNMTVWSSADSGASWSVLEQVDDDPQTPAAYSTMVTHNLSHAGLVYERGGYKTLTWQFVALPRKKGSAAV